MTGTFLKFSELADCVIIQLREQNYMESTLTLYRRLYNRVHSFMQQQGTEIYTNEIGHRFLENTHVCKSAYGTYSCAIRRLNDYMEGTPYRCHHGNPGEEVPEVFEYILKEYLNECEQSGNKPTTVIAKKKNCILFLKYAAQARCSDISILNAELVARALLIYTNKDHYARIHQFLKYLFDKGYTKTELSGVVPRYKRYKVLPTTYTPSEIARIEQAVDTMTETGKRDLAIIRLATRMGFRSGDIAKLKWSEIDFDNGTIHIIQEKTGEPLSLRMPDEVSETIQSYRENAASPGRDDGVVFHSIYSDKLSQYYELRCAVLSESARKHELCYLKRFDDYLAGHIFFPGQIREPVMNNWIRALEGKSSTVENEIIIIRQFLKFLALSGETVFIPAVPKVHEDYIPYIFSDDELRRIFRSADDVVQSDKKADPYLAIEFPVILRLLYNCGLRIGETVKIRTADADLENGILKLVNTKRDKHRLVPMSPGMTDILMKYGMVMGISTKSDGWLFPSSKSNSPISVGAVKRRFEKILKDNGIRLDNRRKHERGPCLHCLRHVFAFKSTLGVPLQ